MEAPKKAKKVKVKRGPSAYNTFFKEEYAKMKKKNKNISFVDASAKISAKWKKTKKPKAKRGTDHCGRLKPGYKWSNGKAVKA